MHIISWLREVDRLLLNYEGCRSGRLQRTLDVKGELLHFTADKNPGTGIQNAAGQQYAIKQY